MSNKNQGKSRPQADKQAAASKSAKATAPANSRREQLRLQQEAEARREQQRRAMIIGGVVVFALVLAIIVGVLIQTGAKQRQAQRTEQGIGQQITPPNANDAKNAMIVAKDKWDKSKPLVTVFEDPQCPGCATAAETVNPMLESLAKKGEIRMQYQILIGLDTAFKTDHSYRGSVAMACAATVDKFEDYARALYAGQPAREGDGWTDAQILNDFANGAGLAGDDLAKFRTCYEEKATHDFVQKMTNDRPSYITSTPSFDIGGKVVRFTKDDVANEQTLLEAVKRYAG